MTLKLDGWSWKIIEHLFYTTLSFVQHFQAIGIFKLELQSGNVQFGSKLAIFFCPRRLWKSMYDVEKQQGTSSILRQALCITSNQLAKSNLSYSLETLKSVKNWRFFVPHDIENWCMTINNRAPLQCCLNLCASFHSQWWIQTGATVWKRPI